MILNSYRFIWLLGVFLLIGCAGENSIANRPGFNRSIHMQSFYSTRAESVGTVLKGESSFYGPGFHQRKTANGESYDQNAYTCAHKTLPFHTVLRVTLPSTGKSVDVRVNDRGPYKDGRIIDLSVAAAKKIGLTPLGVAPVEAVVIKVATQ